MTTERSFFTFADGIYTPTELARSGWSASMINGPAIVAALARGLETGHHHADFQPARLTVDLFTPVRPVPLTVHTTVVRAGKRILVVDAVLTEHGGDSAVARASLVQLRQTEEPPGRIWRPDREFTVPPQYSADPLPPGGGPLFDSDRSPEHWTGAKSAHQDSSRKRSWRHPFDVVAEETSTPFQKAAILAEATSLITNWGSAGIGFINADLTVNLSRLPVSDDLGIEADSQSSTAGVGVGVATLFDRRGVFGIGTIVAVSNAGRQISYDSPDDT